MAIAKLRDQMLGVLFADVIYLKGIIHMQTCERLSQNPSANRLTKATASTILKFVFVVLVTLF